MEHIGSVSQCDVQSLTKRFCMCRQNYSSLARALLSHQEQYPESRVFSLDQSEGRRISTATENLGALKCNSSRRYSTEHKRWLIPAERMLAHGLPVSSWAAESLGVSIKDRLLDLSPDAQGVLAGNGMHIACIFGAIALVCTATSPRT